MKRAVAACLCLLGLPVSAQDSEAPYAGQDVREIAALSQDDIAVLLDGGGWGLALPAELNGYPGPSHVLELAETLDLSSAQRDAVSEIFGRMREDARRLGAEYVAAEAHIDRLFETGHADADILSAVLDDSAETLAALRRVHLTAHLEVTPLLSDGQRARYAEVRGYGADGSEAGDHSGMDHSGMDHAGHGGQ